MASRLGDYLDHCLIQRPAHCGAFLLGWVERATGSNPRPDLMVLDTRAWARLVRSRGGLVRLASEIAAVTPGAYLTRAPRDGDAGVIAVPTGNRSKLREACAIRVGGKWAVMGPAGLMAAPVDALRSWSVGHG